MPLPVPPISQIVGGININAAYLTSDPLHPPSHFELANPPGAEVSIPQLPLLPYVNGPFRIWRLLSAGGFARAIGAEDIASGRLLCLKVFMKDTLKYHGTGKGLLKELEVYKRLASSRQCCPATIFLMELEMSFQTKKNVCFVMDLMANDLTYYMDNESAHCVKNARRWSAQLALGINALHNMGIIHRDIKAENVLIDIRQNVRIADFGLSYIGEPKPLNPWWGYSSSVKGTEHCMAPEILRNMEEPDSMKYGTPVDWWAFGCVLYQLVLPPVHKELFDEKDSIMKYVAWHSEHYGTFDLFPAFHQLDSLVADLLVGLLHPLSIMRYGFRQITSHWYFLNDDGTSEFHGACSRALQREEEPEMLPYLWDEETSAQPANIWCAQPPGLFALPNMDWRKPRP